MKMHQLFRQGTEQVSTIYSKNEAEMMCRLLAEHCLRIDAGKLAVSQEKEVPNADQDCFKRGVERLLQHEPIQYITGEAWFYHLPFMVNEHVLIPRPETEELVERLVKFASGGRGSLLDIGTGSGCIPISFIKHSPGWKATAIDVSAEALSVAKLNAEENDAAVEFIQKDFLDIEEQHSLNNFDIIVSNPPYIPFSEKQQLSKTVTLFEPHLALFVHDPMIFYKSIASFGKDHLKEGGRIFMETHQDHAHETASVFRNEKYSAEVIKDISGNDRMVVASLNR